MEPLNCQDGGQAVVENDEFRAADDDLGCLGIFPEEVWLEILDKVAHSQDILNVLKAFPQLDKSFQWKKTCWLFDQVLPHLMTKHLVIEKNNEFGDHVESKELLKLRLVSKRWKKVVELSIQNHADRRPINSENGKQSASPVGLPVNHFNYNRINKYHLGATVFRTPNQITDFFNEMVNLEGNPFPGKHVYFEIDRDSDDLHRDFQKKAVELLKKFGEHVVHLSLEIEDDSECHLEMCKVILSGLSYVPNLESLKLWGGLDKDNEAADEYFMEAGNMELFPKLEKLTSFEWQVDMQFGRFGWVDRMIDFYGGGRQNGLRRLALDHKYWNAEMAANLDHLTELHLFLDGTMEYEVEDMRNVLRMFPNGQLKRFCLSDYPRIKEDREMYIDELIGMLGEFEIESVVLEKLNLKEKGSELGVVGGGISSLHLDDGLGLSFEFLRRLPNLRFLSVHVPFNVAEQLFLTVARPEEEDVDETLLAFKVRQYFWKVDKEYEWKGDKSFEIWEECEKLEMLSVSVVDGFNVINVQFVRETGNRPFWGWSGREFGEMSPEEEEEELRVDEELRLRREAEEAGLLVL